VIYNAPLADKFILNGKSTPFRIQEAGPEVNSEYDEYGAVLSFNDSVIFFTSRREGSVGGKIDFDDKYFEDIYTSKLGPKGWKKSVNMGSPVNTSKHEAMISTSPDGKKVYFYRGVKQGTFYYSDLVGNAWTTPKVLFEDANMNTTSWETSFFGFTVSGSELYVVSDRDSGIGKRDIYVSKKLANGGWGSLENLGAPINTKYEEDAPFITPDGKTMYFASKGHNSMGGFDIFKSEKVGDKWSEPVNMGRPFNTPGEDIYFVLSNKGDCAYYSSSSQVADGTKDMDIYKVDFCDEIPEILLAGASFGITNGSLSVVEKQSGQKVGDYTIENGKYSARLKHGKDYRFTFNIPSVNPVSADISIPQQCKVYDVYQELEYTQASLTIKNAFFDIKKEASGNYSEYLSKINKNETPLYREIVIPTSVILATADTKTVTPTADTKTVTTASTKTTTPTADTKTVTTASTKTTTPTADTKTVTTASTKTTTPTADTKTVTTTASTKTTTPTADTKTVTTASTKTTIPTADTKTVTTASTKTTTPPADTKTVTTTTTTTSTTTTGTITTISVSNILFDYDQATMRGEFSSELDKVVDFLKTAKNAKIEISGYADGKGSDEYNLALSKRRASAVATYLASKGASKSRIKTIGYGETKPLAPNENPDGSDNPEGRAKNRRTEIVVIQ